jgi:hypothetical protein
MPDPIDLAHALPGRRALQLIKAIASHSKPTGSWLTPLPRLSAVDVPDSSAVRSLSVGAERQREGCGQQPPSSSFVARAEREGECSQLGRVESGRSAAKPLGSGTPGLRERAGERLDHLAHRVLALRYAREHGLDGHTRHGDLFRGSRPSRARDRVGNGPIERAWSGRGKARLVCVDARQRRGKQQQGR